MTNVVPFKYFRGIIPYLTVQKAKKAEKRDIYAKKLDFSFLPRFPKLS